MQNNGKIVFTGGGTGGHIYPNLALIPEFQRREYVPVYLGAREPSLECSLCKQCGIEFHGIKTVKLVRSLSPKAIKNNLKIPYILWQAVEEAKDVLKKIKPVAVFSKGGFVSLPAVIAASRLGIPIFAHESDESLGIANKIAELCGGKILKANPLAKFKGEFVGMPLRESLFQVTKKGAREKLNISTNKKVLLVLGGSSGAEILNEAVLKSDFLTKKFFVIHLTGKGKSGGKKGENYLPVPYADDIENYYAASDLVISRAGATAVFELSALKKRAIFVPLPKGISRGDQIENALLAQKFGGNVLWQDDMFFDNLSGATEKALQNPPMRPISENANGKIASLVCDSIGRGEKCKDKKLSPNGSR